MKRLLLPPAFLGLTALLASCGGGGGDSTPAPSSRFALTVNVTGVPNAPVKVTNTTSKATLFDGPLTGSKTFGDLAAGSVLSVQGGAVGGYATPQVQNVTLDGDKTVVVEYKSSGAAGTAVSNTLISGKIVGTDLQIGSAFLIGSNPQNPLFGEAAVTNTVLTLDLSRLTPSGPDLADNFYVKGCSGDNSDPSARVLDSLSLNAYSPQSDLIGTVVEKVVAGPDTTLPNALIYRLYSDRPFTFKGECVLTTASGTVFTEKNDLKVVKGWNTLVRSVEDKAITIRNAAGGNRAELTFIPASPKVSVYLQPATLNFNSDQSITVDADLIQVGNYSGTVNLSTNLAGLSVEPSTVTLTPLPRIAAQALNAPPARLAGLAIQPQKLTTRLIFSYTGTENLTDQAFRVLVKDAGAQSMGGGDGRITVRRPGIDLYVYTSPLTLGRSSTVEIPFVLTSVMGFGGAVTVTAENLPVGVKATSKTVSVTSDRPATASLTLTSDASLKPGVTPVTITARGEGRIASASLNLEVPKPSVAVSIVNAYNEVAVYQGGTGAIEVLVSSAFGFQGATTLKLTGLPEGVTAAPVSVQVRPMESTTLKIPLVVATDADLGTSSIQVTSPNSARPDGDGPPVRLTVRPSRVALGYISQAGLASGDAGIWVARDKYDAGGFTTTLRHVVGGKDTTAIAVTGPVYQLLSLPDGPVLALGSGMTWVVTDQGAVPTAVAPDGVASGAVDHLGRVVFIQSTYAGSGYQSRLARWTPATGALESVDAVQAYGSGGQFFRSNSGRWMLYRPQYSAGALKINAVTGEVTRLNLNNVLSSVALDDSGTVYFTENGPLQRLNANGTVTIFNDTNPGTLIGFDRKSPTLLWSFYSNGIGRLDLDGNRFTNIPLGNINRAVTLAGGGIAALTSEFSPGEGVDISFLTTLR